MKKVDLKRKKSLLKGVVMGFAVMAALMLLTNCGSAKSVGSVAYKGSEYQLSDDCALLHLYRPPIKIGVAVSFGVHLENEMVFMAKYNSKTTVRVTSEGLKTLWARTEARAELPVDVKLGQEYYIRCNVGIGAFVGRPRLALMDSKEGKKQFDKIK